MDRLYQRYADPISFMNGMISTGRFQEFVRSFWRKIHEEQNEDRSWEFFLHRVFEGSFDDFMEKQKIATEHLNMPDTTIETTLQHSFDILNNFNPERGEQ